MKLTKTQAATIENMKREGVTLETGGTLRNRQGGVIQHVNPRTVKALRAAGLIEYRYDRIQSFYALVK